MFPNYSHFKKRSISELTIPGDAIKDILVDPSNPNFRYIAKMPKKCGQIETLTEYCINAVGMTVKGLSISRSALGMVPNNHGMLELRFLSRFFHLNTDRLTHGIQLFAKYYREDELDEFEKGRKARQLYTIENIAAALELTYPESWSVLFANFVDMCVFDAWVGNQDRHAKNWGIVEPVRLNAGHVRFAPIFDTARGLFWDYDEKHLTKFAKHSAPMVGYINRSRPQFAVAADMKVNHFKLIREIRLNYPHLKGRMIQLVANMQRVRVNHILRAPTFATFSPLRKHLISNCLDLRLKALKKELL